MANKTQYLDNLGNTVTRASKQTPNASSFFTSTYNWVKKMELEEPPWGLVRADYVDNRIRDEWLMTVSRAEPHLSSVLSTAITLDANRQWKLIGGRNQVKRFVKKFREFDNGLGFRSLQELNATNFYSSDLGAIVEIETDGRDGPLESLYHSDSTRFRLGKKGVVKYDSDDGVITWPKNTFYRLASQRSTQDKYNLLGYCSISRCIKLAQIMIAVVEHNLEKLGHIAPKGILFIQAEDLTQEAWDEAMQAREMVYVTGTGNKYYDDVMTIVDRAAKGELLALSELPERFDPFQFTDYMMKGYALAFGRPVRAFWSLNSGNFGGGTETKVQAEQATYGGGADFILASQEQVQWLLPESLIFEYEVEDTGGKFQKAEVDKLLIDAANSMLTLGITPERAQEWLAEKSVIPSEWTEAPVEVADTGVMKQRLLDTDQVQRCLNDNPDEAIVVYESPSVKYPTGRYRTLWNNKREAVGKSWLVSFEKKKSRQAEIGDYDEDSGDVGNFMYAAAAESYLSQIEDPDEAEEEALALALLLLQNDDISDDNIRTLEALLLLALPVFIIDLLSKLREDSNNAEDLMWELHPERWDSRLGYFSNLGMLYGRDLQEELTWVYGDTQHCVDCEDLNGQTHTVEEWIKIGFVPQSPDLSCKGFFCDCKFV